MPIDTTWLMSHLDDQDVAVFLFHGVAPQRDYGVRNYTGKHMAQEVFAQIIGQLSSKGNPVAMDDLLAHVMGESKCPRRSFVITFDDGFWNNVTVAAPVLADFGVPATFYVTSDFIDFNKMSWVDRIEAAVATSSLSEISLPKPLSKTYSLNKISDRISLMRDIRLTIKASRETDAEVFADKMVDFLLGSQPLETVEMLDRKLDWNDVRQLNAEPLFSVGGHGKTHRILGYLPLDEMRNEVTHCLSRLRDAGGVATAHFSYPEGFPEAFSLDVISELRKSDIKTGVTTSPGANSPGQDPMQLHRIFVA